MAAPTTNLNRTLTVTLANPTPPTNSVVTYQGTPPTPQGLAPAVIELPDIVIPWITADPLNGAAAPELSGLAEADGTAQMAIAPSGRVTGHSVLDDYTESPNSDHPSGSSSSLPAWVPANAVIHIDLVGGDPQGRAWVAGTGEVAVDTLLGNDPNVYDYVPGDTGYNSSFLTSDGYDPRGSSLQTAYIGAARAKILSGATVRFVQKRKLDNNDARPLKVVSENGDMECSFDMGKLRIGIQRAHLTEGVLSAGSSFDILPNIVGVIETVAFTCTPTRAEMATMGEAEVLILSFSSLEFPSFGAFFDYTENYAVVQSITLYDPLPSTAGLSDLSEVA